MVCGDVLDYRNRRVLLASNGSRPDTLQCPQDRAPTECPGAVIANPRATDTRAGVAVCLVGVGWEAPVLERNPGLGCWEAWPCTGRKETPGGFGQSCVENEL